MRSRVCAELLAKNQRFEHCDFAADTNRSALASVFYSLGENVGVGANLTAIHAAFMKSAGHTANILSKAFVYFGAGVARGLCPPPNGTYQCVYVVHRFMQPY